MLAPLGRRGERPVFFPCWGERQREAREYPGVVSAPGGVRCTWDAAPFVAKILGEDPSSYTTTPLDDWSTRDAVLAQPGLPRWQQLGMPTKLRPYQKEGALFLAMRDYAMLCDPLRSGKTRTALGGCVLIDASKVLVICPAIAKMVWAQEIYQVLGDVALVLEGRSTDRARLWCHECEGTGLLRDRAKAIHDAHAQEWTTTRIKGLDERARGGMYPCPSCAPARGPSRGNIILRDQQVRDAMDGATFVIVNYDILVVQQNSTSRGKQYWDTSLPGWAGVLNSYRFDVCIADEVHKIRGYTTDQSRRGKTTRERAIQATENVEKVWGITGTPMFGFVRDYWGQLDFISKGAVTGNTARNFFAFTKRYCGGHKGEWGWEDTGKTIFANTELPERLKLIKIGRPRSVILPYMPRKPRQVLRLDRVPGVKTPKLKKRTIETKLGSTYAHKVPTVTENIAAEVSEGLKCIALVTVKENYKSLVRDLTKVFESPEYRTRMRQENVQIFGGTGDTNRNLFEAQAARFRTHRGGAVFVATTDLLGEGSISLASKDAGGYIQEHPVATTHVVDMHYSPGKLFQAEERAFEPGTTGLTVIHYILKDSFDEVMVDTVVPKVEAMASVQNEENAINMMDAFRIDRQTALDALAQWDDEDD